MKWRGMLLAVIAVPACLTAELLPIRAYSIAQGLAADQVGCIVPDSRGFHGFAHRKDFPDSMVTAWSTSVSAKVSHTGWSRICWKLAPATIW